MTVERVYRPDIDGLRALAVLSVIFFHAGYGWAGGGFIGVDVFFVISGYLITRNILSDIDSGKFSFKAFYSRRVRRLFPALFFTLVISFIFSYILFTPPEMERFGRSLLYAIFSLSNFFFWSEAGYFNAASEFKPLLHIWSLSVEEQFYLIWPLLLVVLSRIHKRNAVIGFLIVSVVLSIITSELLISKHPETVFFLLPFRVFELAIGALCVWIVEFQPKNRWILEILVTIGLLFIVWPVTQYSESLAFPGYRAILPCIGAALIIYAGRAPLAGYILRNRIAVGIGLISYSVYLAHWPLLVFYKYWKFSTLNEIDRLLLVAGSLLLGYLMWRFIERPFRFKRGSKRSSKPDSVRFWAPGLAVALSLLAAVTWVSSGWPSRLPDEFFMTKEEMLAERHRFRADYRDPNLLRHGSDKEKHIIVMGNSHALDILYAIRENGSEAGFTFLQTSGDCSNLGWSAVKEKDVENCRVRKKRNLAKKSWSTATTVILHEAWPSADVDLVKDVLFEIRQLTDAPIYVFGPKMIFTKHVPNIIRKSMQEKVSDNSHRFMRTASVNEYGMQFARKEERSALNNMLKTALSKKELREDKINYVDILSLQCGDNINNCEIISSESSKFLYFDRGHFSCQGALEFGEKLKKKYPEVF
ncbi:MAG: acyltransferase family protein [Thermodesulfobacteriota bacterium]